MATTTQMITDGNGHISPFKDQSGNPATVVLDSGGNVPVSGGGGTAYTSFNATAPTTGPMVGFTDGTNMRAAQVGLFHNADNQSPGGSAYGLLTGGVSQLINAEGNLDRQTETYADNRPNLGISSGASQNAMPIGACTISGSVTANASAQNVTLSAVTGTVRGVSWTIQAGHQIQLGTGTANAEWVYVNSVNSGAKTVNVVATKNHSNGDTVSAFVYNQQRDATLADGSSPSGVNAGAAYFWNGTLNSGTGGMEIERSAAGELDGASGSGTALAAEYEYNGGGPLLNTGYASGLNFDRARNLQGKGVGTATQNAGRAAGATSITVSSATAVNTLQAGQQIRIDRNTGTEECAYVSTSYTPGTAVIALQSALQYSHTTATVEWDIFASSGPGLNGFTATGIGIEEEALFNPADGKYYIERSATADGIAAANVVAECPVLWNGATMDRWPGSSALGGKVQIAQELQDLVVTGNFTTNGNSAQIALAGYQSVAFNVAGTWTGTIQPQVSCDGGTTWANVACISPASAPGMVLSFTVNQTMAYPAIVAGASHFRLTATSAMTGTANVTLRATKTAIGSPTLSDASGNQKIVLNAKTAVGTQANLWNAASVSANGNSSSVSVANGSNVVSFFGNASAATTLTIYVSQDNTNFYNSGSTIAANGDFHSAFTSGASYVRLQSSAAATLTATAASKP